MLCAYFRKSLAIKLHCFSHDGISLLFLVLERVTPFSADTDTPIFCYQPDADTDML